MSYGQSFACRLTVQNTQITLDILFAHHTGTGSIALEDQDAGAPVVREMQRWGVGSSSGNRADDVAAAPCREVGVVRGPVELHDARRGGAGGGAHRAELHRKTKK